MCRIGECDDGALLAGPATSEKRAPGVRLACLSRQYCRRCGAFEYRALPEDGDVAEAYGFLQDAEGFSRCGFGTQDTRSAVRVLLRIFGRRPGVGTSVLEVGPGNGLLALLLRRLGCSVTVVEPYPRINFGRHGIEAYSSLAKVPPKKFDYIIGIEVIEHLASPRAFFRELSLVVGPRTFSFFTTPNALGLNARVFRFRWRELANPVHLTLMSSRTLRKVLSKTELRFFEIGSRRFLDPGSAGLKRLFHMGLWFFGLSGSLQFAVRK